MILEKTKDIAYEIRNILGLVTDFHIKYNIGISIQSQEEMYARCNLLLEELGELFNSIEERSNYMEEISDVYYVLTGNLVSMGYEPPFTSIFVVDSIESTNKIYRDLLIHCAAIARNVRKYWNPFDNGFIEEFTHLHVSAINTLYLLANHFGIDDINAAVEQKHRKNMKRVAKKVGNTVVVSNWS